MPYMQDFAEPATGMRLVGASEATEHAALPKVSRPLRRKATQGPETSASSGSLWETQDLLFNTNPGWWFT